ncbi:hypothetical protein CMI42_02500 [Candidatus Pacearchaeota archaeon]|nr:hypothetical protein [Candidatus Pacearchaeota archaeon]
MKGMANVSGVKNHNPDILTLDLMLMKKIMENRDRRKLCFRFFVLYFTIRNKVSDEITIHIDGRNL